MTKSWKSRRAQMTNDIAPKTKHVINFRECRQWQFLLLLLLQYLSFHPNILPRLLSNQHSTQLIQLVLVHNQSPDAIIISYRWYTLAKFNLNPTSYQFQKPQKLNSHNAMPVFSCAKHIKPRITSISTFLFIAKQLSPLYNF